MIVRRPAILHSDHIVFTLFIRTAEVKHPLRLLRVFWQRLPLNELEIVQITFKASDAPQFEHFL